MNKYSNFNNTIINNLFDEVLLKDSFEFYCNTNDIPNTENFRKKFFDFNVPNKGDEEKELKEVFVGQNITAKSTFRVVLCNQIVKEFEFTQALKGKPIIGERQQTFERIKDISSQVEDIDMLVMAELALPISTLYGFCMHSARNDLVFISGIEFMTVNGIAFNFVATILPVIVDGVKDAIPLLRIKNDYTHSEIELINGVEGGLNVPSLDKYIYHLYRWKGISFSTYYCFELANITMRNVFFSLLDFMVVPIWNRDNPYYNALGEATARDLHCYYIQVNTSEYGETRIIEPVSSEKADLARVKGGTIDHPIFRVSFLVSDLKIKELRDSQLLSYALNKDPKHNRNSFKPLPPNWPFENVKKRKRNEKLLK